MGGAEMTDIRLYEGNIDDRYKEYEELLIRRDQLYEEASSILITYTKEFGDLITSNFELKIECIKKKKAIAYCGKMINRGVQIDAAMMNQEIDRDMQLYYAELDDMIRKNNASKNAETVPKFRVQRAKKIYRRLAKQIHPDVNRKTSEDADLKKLWDKIAKAYKLYDVDELEDLEFLVRIKLDDMGEAGFVRAYDNVEDRISRIENEINEILTTEPYTFVKILENDKSITEYREKLQAEHEEYEKYLKELTNTLENVLREGGVSLTWQMN